MSHKTLIIVAVGIAAGYFLSDKIAGYPGFAQAYNFGVQLGNK